MADQSTSEGPLSPQKQALLALEEMQLRLDAAERARTEPIAIIGMGMRFPGGIHDAESYWRLLSEGRDAIGEFPKDRWDFDAFYDSDPDAPGRMHVQNGGFLEDVAGFDAQFFGISPREAMALDPQQRLLLEVSWEALEHAGMAPDRVAGSKTGIYVGVMADDYAKQFLAEGGPEAIDAYFVTGTQFSFTAGRISYILGAHGPSVALDTACSSSSVAIHLACQSLRAGESDMALAGGVNLVMSPETTITMCKFKALAHDGRCKPFDEAADGFARGEGAGIVALKRLSDAVADGDNVIAVIHGSAVNNDGSSGGLTVPNGRAQQAMLRIALENAGVKAHDVDYVEAHGTGTPLGDPIEVRALAAVLGEDRTDENRLMVGSVKSNLGHLDSAAGVAGLIKLALSIQHGKIPASLNVENVNPAISLDELPVAFPSELTPWPSDNGPRIGGVSAFGLSGTNAHFILGEVPEVPVPERADERPTQILSMSAKSEPALLDLARRYADRLATMPPAEFGDACATANQGRAQFEHRLAVVGTSPAELGDRLAEFSSETEQLGVVHGRARDADFTKIAFLFTGQGAQYVGMGRGLYETEPLFRKTLDRCDEILRPYLDKPLLSVLFDDGEDSLLDETAYTQPALFALEYSLAALWRSWGIEPDVVMGHSVGEYAAACFAGVFSLEDGLKLIAERGRLMQQLPKDGSMAAVFATEERVAAAVAPHAEEVSIAAINGPESIVISGAIGGVQAVVDTLEAAGVQVKALNVSHAFHSPLMDPILDAFEQTASEVQYSAPHTPLLSNLTGELIGTTDVPDARFWRDHIRQPVKFAAGIEWLHEHGHSTFLEVGPSPTLLGMGQRCITDPRGDEVWVPSLRQNREDWDQLLESLGSLYVSGCEIDWAGFDGVYSSGRERVSLPTYPFQRQRFWFEPASGVSAAAVRRGSNGSGHPLLGQRLHSPLKDIQFETVLASAMPEFMLDHQIYGAVVVPGTAFVEMALAGADSALGDVKHGLENVSITEAMILPSDPAETRTAQLILTPGKDGTADFQVLSQTESDEWRLHASGSVAPLTGISAELPSLNSTKERFVNELDVDDFYSRFRAAGLEYGTAFRGITDLWSATGEVFGRIALPSGLEGDRGSYGAHPALFDAALQLVLAASLESAGPDGRPEVYLPIQIGSISVHESLPEQLWGHARVGRPESAPEGALLADVTLYDDSGTIVAEVGGLQVKRASQAAMQRMAKPELNDWLYEVRWEQQDLEPVADYNPTDPGTWLIFTDEGGPGSALAKRLEEEGEHCTLVVRGTHFRAIDSTTHEIDPAQPEDFDRLLAQTVDAKRPLRGVVYLWGLEAGAQAADVASSAGALHVCQALSRSEVAMDSVMWIVTRGSQSVGPDPSLPAPAQAAVWGLGGVMTSESPDLRCIRLDLDPWPEGDETEDFFAEVWASRQETQVALRRGERYRARLARSAFSAADDGERLDVPADAPFRLTVGTPGLLDTLTLEPMGPPEPGPGEISIRVLATGLNFKDVLKALGRYPISESPLGDECAGIISAIGEGVQHLQVGDRVAAVAYGSFRSDVVTRADLAVAIPDGVSFAAATTLPVTYLTAAYTLNNLAHLEAGQRVLIHAGAGGVGMIAVQLAKLAGAEIFATAGTPRKRALLRSLGVDHVMDSRTLDFADEIITLTGGRGIDVVLNSLAGDFIPRSLSVLGSGGTFLEIGRTDIWDAEQIAATRPDVAYHVVYLGDVVAEDPALIQTMLRDLMVDVVAGRIDPLPVQVFPIQDVAAAMRFMGQAKHIGKVVVTQEDAPAAPANGSIRSDGTYLITGGLGGIGLEVATWLASQGASHLVLVGRSGAKGAATEAVRALEESGVKVKVGSVDVSDTEQVAELLAEVRADMPPLRGVIHSAAVIDDGALIHQTKERFERVFAPKTAGAWNLHMLTRDLPLDFFVLFSSWAVLAGLPGQGNYVAANAFLDSLAHHRRAQGLTGLSVNWGAWASVGLAASMDEQNQRKLADMGVTAFAPELGIAALGRLIESSPPQVAVVPIDWSRYFDYHPRVREVPFFSDMAVEADLESQSAIPAQSSKQAILEADPSERRALAETSLREIAARVLKLPVANVLVDVPLVDQGLDSLMTTELLAQIERTFDQRLPLATLITAPTVTALSSVIAEGEEEEVPEATPVEAAAETGAASWNSLVPIRTDGDKRPVYFIHAEAGNILFYRDLASHLPDDRPIYALQAQGLDGAEIVEREVEEMAAHYIEEIHSVQPDGPYTLGGFCMGGVLAFEMAQQLKARGQEVDQVMMIQSRHRDHVLGARATLRQRLDRAIDRWDYEWSGMAELSAAEKLRYLTGRIGRIWTLLEIKMSRKKSSVGGRIPHTDGYFLEAVAQCHNDAFLKYEPEPYDGRVVVVRVSKQPRRIAPDKTLGWDDLITSEPEVVTVDAYHQRIMQEPAVGHVAGALKPYLDSENGKKG